MFSKCAETNSGPHGVEVLMELGYTWEEIETLNRKGVTAFGETDAK
jgi:hypothetical protein